MALSRRYFEDVTVGDELGPLKKAPSTVSLFRFSAVTWNPHRIHYDQQYATQVEGYSDVLVQAHLHGAYLTQLVMDWMGAGGVLRRIGWQNRRPAVPGDVLVCRGKVTAKEQRDGSALVTCDIWEHNQRGEVCVPGEATIELPLRASS